MLETDENQATAPGRQAEEALNRNSDALRTLTEASPLPIVVEDPGGRVRLWNGAAERVLGWSAAEVVGRANPAVRRGHLDDHRHLCERVLNGESLTALETRLCRRDGSVFDASLSVAPLLDSEGRACAVLQVFADVTERKELEAQLRQAQKMEAVGRLAGGLAHDFNNVLTAIVGYAGLVRDQIERRTAVTGPADEAEALVENVEEILKAADRAAALTKGLLAFSRNQVMQPTILDINAVLAGLEKLLRPIIGEHIDFATIPGPNTGRVRADRIQLEQVVMNLVVNARDAMPAQGGRLTIETSEVELTDLYARRRVPVIPGTYVMLAVSDNGCGMDRETLDRAFEPFFTTKDFGKGTGLGLSVAYGIIRQSGGHIWPYSEVGRGTTFKVYLPKVSGAAQEASAARKLSRPPGGTETVLLVEDEEIVRTLVHQVLTRHGYRVLVARNGEEAAQVASGHGGTIDLVLTDVVMPGMAAADLVAQLSVGRPGLKVLYVSGYADHAVSRSGLLERKVEFLQKPFAPDRLAHKVREVLDRASPNGR